jgi:HlyD family secretion protein
MSRSGSSIFLCELNQLKSATKRTLTLAIGLLVILAGGGGLYWVQKGGAFKREQKPMYRTAEVDRGNITQFVTASGTLQPVGVVNVGTQVSGTVIERLADFNDRVAKGQILLRLDPTILQASIRQGQANQAAASATLELAKSNFNRNNTLIGRGFISAAALDQSRKEVEAAEAQVLLAKAQLERAQADLSNSVIRSPMDGIIIKRSIDIGQTVAASFQTPDLFQVARDLKEMQIHTSVSEADVGLLKEGQEVRFTVDAYPDREFTGRVTQFRLAPNVQQNVVTYNVITTVANPDETLKPGMTAQTRIVVASKQGVVRVPTAALRFRPSDLDDAMQKAAAFGKGKKADKDDAKKDAPQSDASAKVNPLDDGDIVTTKSGARIFKVYRLEENNILKPTDVTIGIANTRFTEMLTGELKPGEKVVVRSLVAEMKGL